MKNFINSVKGTYSAVKQSLSKKLDECVAWAENNKKTIAYIRVVIYLLKAALFIRRHWHWVEWLAQVISGWF